MTRTRKLPPPLPGERRAHPLDQAFTFGLRYPGPSVEEIDVWATSYSQARTRLAAIAQRDYDPSFDAVLDLPVGGSGGWVQVL